MIPGCFYPVEARTQPRRAYNPQPGWNGTPLPGNYNQPGGQNPPGGYNQPGGYMGAPAGPYAAPYRGGGMGVAAPGYGMQGRGQGYPPGVPMHHQYHHNQHMIHQHQQHLLQSHPHPQQHHLTHHNIDAGHLRRQGSVMMGERSLQQKSSFHNGKSNSNYGSFYRAGSFVGGYGSYHMDAPAYNRQSSLVAQSNIQSTGNNLAYGSAYGRIMPNASQSGASSNAGSLHRTSSAVNFDYSFGNASGNVSRKSSFNNGTYGIGQKPSETSLTSLNTDPNAGKNDLVEGDAPPQLQRYNSMTLKRTNSAINGFYEFGPEAQSALAAQQGRQIQTDTRCLSSARLMGKPGVPPGWQPGMNNSTSTSMTSPPTNPGPRRRPAEPQAANSVPPSTPQSGGGELTRKNSEKRIGMYFKDVQPTQSGEYKKEGDPGTGRGSRSMDPAMMTRVRTILLLDKKDGNNIEVDGCTAILSKPNSDELVKYDTNEIVQVSGNDLEVFVEGMDELRDTFLMGCNVGIIMADSACPAHNPSQWFTWKAVRQLMKNIFARANSRCEFTVSLSLLEDDQVMDLLLKRPHFVHLDVAQSPLFGNVAHGVVYQVIEDASEFEDLLDDSLAKVKGTKGEECGIILLSVILKQIRTNTPHTKGDEEDIVLSSLFVSGVGDGIIHYNRIMDKNPAEPRAMFQFALGGPSMTAAIFSIHDSKSNAAEVTNFMATLQRLGDIENFRLRLGSVRRFVTYSKESIPKSKERIKTLSNREKTAAVRSLERLELMVEDAEAMLENPKSAVAKTYVRQ